MHDMKFSFLTSLNMLLYLQVTNCLEEWTWRARDELVVGSDQYAYEYHFSDMEMSFQEAAWECNSHEAQLVSVADMDEKAYLAKQFASVQGTQMENYWIGLYLMVGASQSNICRHANQTERCLQYKQRWKWLDVPEVSNTLTLNAWSTNEPTGDSRCARLTTIYGNSLGDFADRDCKSQYRFICKRVIWKQCEDFVCTNDGTCVDKLRDYTCECPYGDDCKLLLGDCKSYLCLNEGTCNNSFGAVCQCTEGYSGDRCEKAVSPAVLRIEDNKQTNRNLIIGLVCGIVGFVTVSILLIVCLLIKTKQQRTEKRQKKSTLEAKSQGFATEINNSKPGSEALRHQAEITLES